MSLVAAVLVVFAAALAAPVVHRFARGATGWVLALVPAALTAYFAAFIGRVETPVRASLAWVPALDVSLAFYLDGLGLFFALLVLGVGALIVVYSGGYLHGHDQAGRFFAYLLLFMGSMLGLVLADNLATLYVFFELTSLSSYLLIGFEHEERASRRAAKQALLVTNAGGLALLAGLLMLEQATGTFSLSDTLDAGAAVRQHALYAPILLCVLAAAFTKSAQFPFYFWLPNAMNAPTPVSAYLHSAAMVKAGIYLLARMSPVLGGTALWTWTVTGVGALTMVVSAWLALQPTDVKRILAYSTVMALGLLTAMLGWGGAHAVTACLTFIVVHACYKAALFMVAGAVDHAAGTRDLGDLRGLRRTMPWTAAAAVLAAVSMAGLPPTLGFIGKELVYATALGHGPGGAGGAWLLTASVLANVALVAAAGLVAVRPFFGAPSDAARSAHRAPPSMLLGPAVLAVGGLALGLAPGLLEAPVVHPAAAAVVREAVEVGLSLWHGLTPELGLSAVTVALGAAVYGLRSRMDRGLDVLHAGLGQGLDRGYDAALAGTLAAARRLTALVEHRRLPYYLSAVFGGAALLVGGTLLTRAGVAWPGGLADVRFYEAALVGLIAAATLSVLHLRSRLAAILALSAVGYSLALLYLLFSAPDLALTQLLVETLVVVLAVLVFVNLPQVEAPPTRGERLRRAGLAAAVGATVTLLLLAVLVHPLPLDVSTFYAEHAYAEAHGRNIVNVILVDFRALDTLGEITVLAVAGLSVYALARLRRPDLPDRPDERDASSA